MVNKNNPGQGSQTASHNCEEEIRRLKAETGQPIIGYLCCFAPPEIIRAAGALPYRITGETGADTTAADLYMEPYGCTYVRNILAGAASNRYDFLDGLVISHSCDMVQRLYGLWTYYHPLPYSYLFNVPHQVTPWAQRFYRRELDFFRESLEKFTGNKVSPALLGEEIKKQNLNRARIRKLYRLRKENPAAVSSSDLLSLLITAGALPPEQFGARLDQAIENASTLSEVTSSYRRPRLLVWGSIIDNPAFFRLIEEAGADIVTDDTCIGFRTWNEDIPLTEDPCEGLTDHYFINFQCPRTDRGPGLQRFAYLLDRAREYQVDGVIFYCISFCDPHKFDYPDLRDYLKKEGISLLLIDDNYSFEPQEAIRTRLQAFLELL